jgi:GAF domain-containing protein
LEEAEQRLQEVHTLLGRRGQQGWERLSVERPRWGYVYDGVEVHSAVEDAHSAVEDAHSAVEDAHSAVEDAHSADKGHRLTVPLRVRGKAIGHVDLAMPGRPPTPEEEAVVRDVVNQASLALENARLYQDTQRHAAREQLIGEVTARMRETLDVEMVLQTAAREIREAMGLHDVAIHLEATNDHS